MTTKEILQKYLDFFLEKDHKQIPNVSLVPEGDPTLLFVNSGMFPLVPYLSGELHPLGKKLINVQRAIRIDDIEDIGDSIHTLVFHMIGNWSLGDYFKKEQLPWIYEFYIEKLGLDPQKIYASVFEGDNDAPKDQESINLIKEIFKKYNIDAKEGERIFTYGKKENWWQRGDAIGELGGPNSEMFYYIGSQEEPPLGISPADNPLDFVEIGNSVFLQFKKTEKGWEELPQKNVDFGGGLERTAMVVQNKKDIFETDNFWPIVEKTQELTGLDYNSDTKTQANMRIVADHVRSVVFLAMDGVIPSNKDRGYIMRRLLRRLVRSAMLLGYDKEISVNLVDVVIDTFSWLYPDLQEKSTKIKEIFSTEEKKFKKTLQKGRKEVEKRLSTLDSKNKIEDLVQVAFDLFQSLGYPVETFLEDLDQRGIAVKEEEFNKIFKDIFNKHQELSRSGAEKKFKGGLADHSEIVIKYHTATHLLHKALREVLGDEVTQVGSNITNERLRFDFTSSRKLTDSEINWVEEMIEGGIKEKMKVQFEVMQLEEAKKAGALFLKNETYPEKVNVYFIGESLDEAFSKEFCGGPHVQNTSELEPVKIFKQESIGEGKMRVYARFEN